MFHSQKTSPCQKLHLAKSVSAEAEPVRSWEVGGFSARRAMGTTFDSIGHIGHHLQPARPRHSMVHSLVRPRSPRWDHSTIEGRGCSPGTNAVDAVRIEASTRPGQMNTTINGLLDVSGMDGLTDGKAVIRVKK